MSIKMDKTSEDYEGHMDGLRSRENYEVTIRLKSSYTISDEEKEQIKNYFDDIGFEVTSLSQTVRD